VLTEKISCIEQTVAGMVHLHEENIIHRDLAARNVLVGKTAVKIADFGLSKMLDDQGYATAEVIGPVQWLAPESLVKQKFSKESDVWMFGCLLLEIFNNGAEPFPCTPLTAVINLVVNQRKHAHISKESVPPAFRSLIRHCFQRDKAERPTFANLSRELITNTAFPDWQHFAGPAVIPNQYL